MTDLYLIKPSRELETDAMKYRSEYFEHGEAHINALIELK